MADYPEHLRNKHWLAKEGMLAMPKFVISFFLFLLINYIAARTLPGIVVSDRIDPSASRINIAAADQKILYNVTQPVPKHTWAQWALMDYQTKKNNPAPIVFLGSSLMLMPLNLADASFLNRTIDGALHHTSLLFDYLVGDNKQLSSNFNFALPGAMASDAYLITNLLLQEKNNPELIIYGIGPRDFLDNLLISPTSTDIYHCLSDLLKTDPNQIFSFTGKGWQSQLNEFLNKNVILYAAKENLDLATSQELDNLFSAIPLHTLRFFHLSSPTLPERMSSEKLHKLLPHYNPMSIDRNQCLFSPHTPVDPDRFTNNLDEYRMRYHTVNWDTFACQTKFFVDLLKLTRTHNVKVLVVAMPITSVNRQLLPDYVFTAYKENLRVLSKSYGAQFVDLDDTHSFNDQDFLDTVHLNATGGSKFLKLISNYVRQFGLFEQEQINHKQLANTGIKI